ncbi:MAG TPA: MFS transporter, partial [Bryobacteraceae bacterium]|nr:MFS transporter [Bryobacteraceae bacterium]
GALGFVWLIFWLLLYHLPEQHPLITQEELQLVRKAATSNATQGGKAKLTTLLRAPQTLGLLLARFLSDPVWWFYLFWLPKYLVEQRHFSLVQMGMLAWLPYLSADLGSFGGGILSGWLVSRGWDPLRARRAVLLPFAALMALSYFVPYVPSSGALAIISIVTFAHMGWKTNLMTITNDIYPVRLVGSVSGVIAFGSGLGGTLFTGLTGQIVQHYSYAMIFLVMCFLHPISWLIVHWLVREPLQMPVSTEGPSYAPPRPA